MCPHPHPYHSFFLHLCTLAGTSDGSLPLKSGAHVNVKIKSVSQDVTHQTTGKVPARGNVAESCGISTLGIIQGSVFNRVRLLRNFSLFLAFMIFVLTSENPNAQSLLLTTWTRQTWWDAWTYFNIPSEEGMRKIPVIKSDLDNSDHSLDFSATSFFLEITFSLVYEISIKWGGEVGGGGGVAKSILPD